MSKDKFALAYSVKRMAKTRRAAPIVEEAPSEPLEAVPGLEEESILAPEPKAGIDIGKLIKKHRFFRSK